jgi:hypothetical protein
MKKTVLNEWLFPLMNNGNRESSHPAFLASVASQARQENLNPIELSTIQKIIGQAANFFQKNDVKSSEIDVYLEIARNICNQQFSN